MTEQRPRPEFCRWPVFLILALLIRAAGPIPAQSPGRAAPERSFTLEETLSRIGAAETPATLRWDPFFAGGVFSRSGHYAVFDTAPQGAGETGLVLLDTQDLLSLPAPYLENGVLRFPESFVHSLKQAFDTRIQNDQSRIRVAAIIIDPGHGGKDSGALGEHRINGRTLKVVEKDITLRASRILYTMLTAAYPDKRILLTRTGDTYPTLEDRVALANSVPLEENEAIVYISLHANASFNRNARGFEVWYLSPEYRRDLIDKDTFSGNTEIIPIWNDMLQEEFTTESIMIAQAINNRIAETMGRTIPSRGIKAEEWFVVRNARMPSVLVELGFVTNEADALILTTEASLRNLTEAIYNGIADYITTFEGSGGYTINP
jgi:N-acetylmuramoyl-L-alanine amidase